MVEDRNYFKKFNVEERKKLLYKIYSLVSDSTVEYPNYFTWFFNNYSDFDNDERDFLLVRDFDKIVGVSLLKKMEKEKKICTLFVDEKYRNMGIGSLLVEESFKALGTSKPLITVPSEKVEEFNPLLSKYNFSLYTILRKYYNNNSDEYCYNGTLKQLIKKENKN